MKNIPLECPNAGCELGDNGQKYKTPVIEAGLALRMLDLHVQLNHMQAQGITSAPVTNRNMREMQKKPGADMEMMEAKWRVGLL